MMTGAMAIGDQTNIGELAKALGEFQAGLKPVKRNMENPRFQSRYADLAAVVGHCKKRLKDYGLVVLQTASSGVVDGTWQGDVTTRLLHLKSGQFIQSNLSVPCFDAQSLAKGITYGRRIAYQTIVGLVVESDDDDGNAANGERAEPTVPGAMETTRLRVSEVLKTTKRKFRPYYRMRGSDANVYGTFDEAIGSKFSIAYSLGVDVAVTWKQVYETREVHALEDVPEDQQSKEPAL